MSDNIKKTDDERVLMILNEINKNDSILDLGCVDHSHLNENSSDWIHKFLYDKSDDVLGIDFENEDIDILQKKGYNVIFGDVENFDLNKEFDVIVAGHLLPSLSNPGLFLNNVHKHLKKNGKFILTTANAWVFYRCLNAFFGINKISAQHTMLNDLETLNQLLQRHGFEIIKSDFILYPKKRKTNYHWPNKTEFEKYREYTIKNKSNIPKTILAFIFRKFSVFFYSVGMKSMSGEGIFLVCTKIN